MLLALEIILEELIMEVIGSAEFKEKNGGG